MPAHIARSLAGLWACHLHWDVLTLLARALTSRLGMTESLDITAQHCLKKPCCNRHGAAGKVSTYNK
eukprot:4623161-Amphidinium_carterae.1